jgi:translocon-associated protein subunit delta
VVEKMVYGNMFTLVGLLFLFTYTSADVCTKPEVSASAYTTQDATVLTNVAFVAEFTLKCGNHVTGLPLYAEINGKTLPAARIGDDNKYQVSWTEDVKKARSGDYSVNLYDEEGYAALRKAVRSGEDPSSVKSLVTIVVNYPGAYQGPWVNSEFMAAILSVLVWYLAFSARSKLLA